MVATDSDRKFLRHHKKIVKCLSYPTHVAIMTDSAVTLENVHDDTLSDKSRI